MVFLFLITFATGERLEYDAKFSFFNLGSMVLHVEDTLTQDSMPCYHFSSTLISNPSFKFIFSLHDTINVYSTIDDLLPIEYTEHLHESSYQSNSTIRFDHDSLVAEYNDTLSIDIPENTRDLVSFWYYLRTIPLVMGDTITLNIHASEDNHTIDCLVDREEMIKTPLGEFQTILISPITKGKGVFGAHGEMSIWYTSDSLRLPVQIKAKMKFGNVLFKIKEIRY
jgi:hypothetical protein